MTDRRLGEAGPTDRTVDGVRVVLVGVVRNHPGSVNPMIKSNNLMNSALAMQQALRSNAFEGVMRNYRGELTECTTANLFIVKNNAAVGWNARGFDHGEAVKAVTIPLTADTVFRLVHGTRNPTRGHATQSPGTAQALARLGGGAQGIMAVPLILRDKVAAILYCDSTHDDVAAATADVVEIMVAFAAKVIDVLSGAARASTVPGGTSPGMRPAAPAEPATSPPRVLSLPAITIAPVAGSWSRLQRLASPNLPAPCMIE